MADSAPTSSTNSDTPERPPIIIDYVPTEGLRTTYVSGTTAIPTPEGLINVLGFVERKSFPSRVTISPRPDEQGSRWREDAPSSWVRELQFSLLMDEDAVSDTIDVLQQSLDELKERRERLNSKENEDETK